MTNSFHVVVSGVPYGCQDARPDGTWLTDSHRGQIQAVSPRIKLHHLPAALLNKGDVEVPPPNALLVESSGTKREWEDLPGVLFGEPLRRLITPDLLFLQSASAGIEQLVELVPSDVVLCNASGVHANAIAETVIGAILSRAKLFPQRREAQRQRRWEQLPCREIMGSTMCVLGTGHIGTAVARLAQTFGVRTRGVRRTATPAPFFDEIVGVDRMIVALDGADFLVVACPLTPVSRGLIGAAELAALRPGAMLINVARGAIVDEASLLEALRSGQLAGAFLDAHVQEPLPPDHPFWSMDSVDVLPHDSHASQLMGDKHVGLFCQNLERCLAGTDLLNVVSVSRGY
jgi:phosphoglycerate dehydrogenase-like enzyme